MTQLNIWNTDGKIVGNVTAPINFEECKVSNTTIYNIVRCLEINQRIVRSGHYKSKRGISGSSKKIRPQKRTGRSRQGTSKEIHMRGGGVKFGFSSDKTRDKVKRFRAYRKINKKVQQKVKVFLLANKHNNNRLMIVDSLDFTKTSDASRFLSNVNGNKHLVVYSNKKSIKPFNNLKCKLTNISSVNTLDIISKESVIIELNAFNQLIRNITKQSCITIVN